MKNKILAIEAAPAATPPNPKIAAMIATIKKITVQRSIKYDFSLKNGYTIVLNPKQLMIVFENFVP